MTTLATTVWAAQDALLAALQTQTWPDQINPKRGTPAALDRDAVWISGEVDDWPLDYAVSGYRQMDESYVLRIHILATRLGTYTDLREKLATYGGKVETAVVTNYTLGGAVAQARIDRRSLEETLADDGRTRQGLLTFWVRCTAWVPKT